MSTCRSCNAEIEWAQTERGKRIPLDVDRVENGNLVVDHRVATEHGMTPVVRYVTAGEGNRASHFSTCPDAEEYRR